jgi:hypothetical protein
MLGLVRFVRRIWKRSYSSSFAIIEKVLHDENIPFDLGPSAGILNHNLIKSKHLCDNGWQLQSVSNPTDTNLE